MDRAQILDCTLRDGAYLVDKNFGNENIVGIVNGLVKAGIDIVEIGFLQNEGEGDGKTVYRNAASAQKFIPQNSGNTKFAVLADYSRYNIENLEENKGDSFDIVRACFFKNEKDKILQFCKEIKSKGYDLFVQPVDVLGYTDKELIELIEVINVIQPYCFSIVDTFGSMYIEDLRRVFSLIDNNLDETIKIGFHSHNNMQMSSALSQEFISLLGRRKGVVDTTISGMGRGAGNTPTELVAQYMCEKIESNYDMDAILDLIDNYMENIRTRCEWGYSTEFFIAGSYGAHVNNIAYLKKKNSLESKDVRYILNKLTPAQRKRYDYDLLEKTYMDSIEWNIDDTAAINNLSKILKNRNIVIVAPGKSIESEEEKIAKYIKDNNASVISINHVSDFFHNDYIFVSNKKRFEYWRDNVEFVNSQKIVTSNIEIEEIDKISYVSFMRLIKCGWMHFDNATLLLLRLLDLLEVKSIMIAGVDGYSFKDNYITDKVAVANSYEDPMELNRDMRSMLMDFAETRKHKDIDINFITKSRFSDIVFGRGESI